MSPRKKFVLQLNPLLNMISHKKIFLQSDVSHCGQCVNNLAIIYSITIDICDLHTWHTWQLPKDNSELHICWIFRRDCGGSGDVGDPRIWTFSFELFKKSKFTPYFVVCHRHGDLLRLLYDLITDVDTTSHGCVKNSTRYSRMSDEYTGSCYDGCTICQDVYTTHQDISRIKYNPYLHGYIIWSKSSFDSILAWIT